MANDGGSTEQGILQGESTYCRVLLSEIPEPRDNAKEEVPSEKAARLQAILDTTVDGIIRLMSIELFNPSIWQPKRYSVIALGKSSAGMSICSCLLPSGKTTIPMSPIISGPVIGRSSVSDARLWEGEKMAVLFLNALEFRSDEDPVIKISGGLYQPKQPEQLPCLHAKEFCRITVEDNGIGFDQKYLDRIFMPFERLHGSGNPGTGMGLAICRKIAEIHGGTITAMSIPREGSTFIITLPVKQDLD